MATSLGSTGKCNSLTCPTGSPKPPVRRKVGDRNPLSALGCKQDIAEFPLAVFRHTEGGSVSAAGVKVGGRADPCWPGAGRGTGKSLSLYVPRRAG